MVKLELTMDEMEYLAQLLDKEDEAYGDDYDEMYQDDKDLLDSIRLKVGSIAL